jgi:hypothetical protein
MAWAPEITPPNIKKQRKEVRRAAAVRLSPVVQMRRLQIRRVANIACSGVQKGKPSPDVDSKYQRACVVEMMKRKYRQHGGHPTRRGRAVGVCCVEHRPCARAT